MRGLWGAWRGYDRAIVYWGWWEKRKNTMRWAESDKIIDLGSLTTAEAILGKCRYCQTKANTRHQQTIELFFNIRETYYEYFRDKKKLNNETKAEAIGMWCRLRGNVFEHWEASCSNYIYKDFLDMEEVARALSQVKKVW